MNALERMIQGVIRLFPLWVLVFSAIAYANPIPFKPFAKYIPYGLGIIMLGMGLTMTLGDFRLVFTRPRDVLLGVILRYVIMPVVGVAVAKLLNLPPALAAGLILVGCCPSGTASNVMTFLARGDTALSVTVSSINTLLAPILTPFLYLYLAGSIIPINVIGLLTDIIKIVLLPVLLGLLIRTCAGGLVQRFISVIPLLSVITIVLVIAVVVALNAGKLAIVGTIAFLAVALHNAVGLLLGYNGARLFGMAEAKARAVAFEIGIENSGLAVSLALAYLDPLASIPGAIFSVWHNMTGSLLAWHWSKKGEAIDNPSSTSLR